MEFRILGPVEVWDAGRQLQIGGAKQRALLAALLLHANEVVPGDRLIDELWGEDPPECAATALRVNVSRLRKALPPDVLVTRSPGYTIRLGPDQLDLYRFERLVDEARRCLARREAGRRLRAAAGGPGAVAGAGARGRLATRASPRRRSPGSRRSGLPRSSCASRPTSRSATIASWSASSRRSSPSTRSASVCEGT